MPPSAVNSQTGVSTRNAQSAGVDVGLSESKTVSSDIGALSESSGTETSSDSNVLSSDTEALSESSGTETSSDSKVLSSDTEALSVPALPILRKPKPVPRWYALRTTYGREKKAYNYLSSKQVVAYYPTITAVKLINGKRRKVEESRLPNIFFAYGTEDELKSYVYDNVNLPFLRFYYRHFHVGRETLKEPLVVPDHQIESLRIICAAEENDIILVPSDEQKFEHGQVVRVIAGNFKGVVGRVARYCGQQRVGVVIDGLLTIATAYIPTAYLEKLG
ncbi:MAG: UpxY family transcription antiterminator [Prevotella sp.]|nr:UpxY family transcription antiterminator [Prevotella sp.]